MTHDTSDPFDRKVAGLMHDLAADVTAPPAIPRRVTVRARLGQAFIVGGVAVSVLLIVFAAGVALRATGARDPIRPVPGGPLEEERGSGGTYPCSVEPEPHQPPKDTKCVAKGEFEGTGWSMVTYPDRDGRCLDVTFIKEGEGGGGGGSCGVGDEQPTLGVGISSGDEQGEVAYGEVAPEVALVEVERENGDSFEVELYPAPQGSGLDVNFYLVLLPEDHAAIVAYNSKGEEIDRQKTNHEFRDPAEPLGPAQTVATGDVEGQPWVLEAYEQKQGDNVQICTELMFGRDETQGAGGGCSMKAPVGPHIGFSQSGFGQEFPNLIALVGTVSTEVVQLDLELDDGRVIPIEIIEGPADFETAFFVAFPPPADDGGLPGYLVGKDASGEVLDRVELCKDRIAGKNLTCTHG